MSYKYETHAHTKETSKCSRIPGAELAHFYKSRGYTGLFVTDHFYNGNTTVPHEGEWKERVELFEAGYLAAKAEGDKIGLDVFMAWEYSWHGNDFLIYGLDRNWLLDNPGQLELKPREYMQKVRDDGGLVIHAHPFRAASYIEAIKLIPDETDGVEIFNASRIDPENEAAKWYAQFYGKIVCAGSDNHNGAMKRLGGVSFERRIESITDFVDAMKNGEQTLFADNYQ